MIALSSTSSSSTIARAPRAAFRGGRRAASPRKRVAIARASKDDDALSRNAKKALGALIAIPTSIALSSGAVALADDDAVDVFAAADATAEESAAFTAATAEDAAFEAPADAPDVAEAPVVEEAPPMPQGTADALSAYEQATRSGGNSNVAKSVVEKGKPKKSSSSDGGGGIGGLIGGVVGVGALGAAAVAAFKAGSAALSNDSEDDDEGSGSYYEEDEDDDAPAKPAFSLPSFGKSSSEDDDEGSGSYYEEPAPAKPAAPAAGSRTIGGILGGATATAAAAAAAKKEAAAEALAEKREAARRALAEKKEAAALALEEKREAAAAAKAERAALKASTQIMKRPEPAYEEEEEERPAFPSFTGFKKAEGAEAFESSTVRMPTRASEDGSSLPRGFPTIDDLKACETAEEKEDLCDAADAIVERLERKAEGAEAFVDGPVCGFFGFLKPNAIRNAEKARAAADEAAAAAAALRRASAGGPSGGLVAGIVAALVAVGAAAVVLGGGGGGGGGDAPTRRPKQTREPRVSAPKPQASASAGSGFGFFAAPETKSGGPYGLEAESLVEDVKSGKADALSAYEALQRK